MPGFVPAKNKRNSTESVYSSQYVHEGVKRLEMRKLCSYFSTEC